MTTGHHHRPTSSSLSGRFLSGRRFRSGLGPVRRAVLVLAAAVLSLSGAFASPSTAQEAGGRDDGPRGVYYGVWTWREAPTIDRAILYRAVQRRRANQILLEQGTLIADELPDSTSFSLLPSERWVNRNNDLIGRADREVDLATGTLTDVQVVGTRPFGVVRTRDVDGFSRDQMSLEYYDQLERTSLALIASTDADGSESGGLFRLTLPPAPGPLTSIFGNAPSSLSVSGSERISLEGTSTWFPNRNTTGLSSQSKFPDLDMRQDLFLKLTGTIGDKVQVNIDQNSNADTDLDNLIRIQYKGYEDEIIQQVNLGNTSLSLPGTQYVSYGGRHEGLFGVSAEAQMGPIKLTGIASKQESEATTRSVPSRNSSSTSIDPINARNYVKRKYFFVDNPNRVRLAEATINDSTVVDSFLVPVSIDAANIKLFFDDLDGDNNVADQTFEAYVTPTGLPPCACPEAPPECDDTFPDLQSYTIRDVVELQRDLDYIVHSSRESFSFIGTVIELIRPLTERDLLAVSFITTDDEPLFNDVDGDGVAPDTIGTWQLADAVGCDGLPTYRMMSPPEEIILEERLDQGPWADALALEIRNVYRLGGINIDELDLEIVWDRTGGSTQATNFENVPYLEILGLDASTLNGTVVDASTNDGVVDRRYFDATEGLLHFPQLRPFAPDYFDRTYRRDFTGLRGSTFGVWPLEPELVGTSPDSGNFPEADIYDDKAVVYGQASGESHIDRYQLRGEFRSRTSVIQLNQFNIIENSEKVTAGGRELVRGSDYTIDYEFGTVTISENANVGPDDDVDVTFAYAPLFGASSKTLAGLSASLRPEGGTYGLSSTWLYESQGNPDRRVKLGEEPTQTIIGELAADYKSESTFLTNLLSRLPLYTPAARSQVTMNAAVGVSIPNPNTKNQAYIDDFDASQDSRDLSLTRRSWRWPSVPVQLLEEGLSVEAAAERRGEQVWYSPRRSALRGDINPLLAEDEADDGLNIIEWWMTPNATTDSGQMLAPEDNWYGLLQNISQGGEDFSTAQFIEIWYNDFNDSDFTDTGVLYIDVGEMSEDAIWWPNAPDTYSPPPGRGIGILDSEDANSDGQLDDTGDADTEDTGLDGVPEGEVFGREDMNDDDFDVGDRDDDERVLVENFDRFRKVNGLERNSSLDTEDLNGDNRPNFLNSYFTYRIDLGDNPYVVTDIGEEFGDLFDLEEEARNGWKLLRIPLGEDFEFARVGSPDYTRIKHVRLWVTGVTDNDAEEASTPETFDHDTGPGNVLQIASVQFVGNRWLTGGDDAPILNAAGEPASDAELLDEENFAISVVNNKDDGELYEAAFPLNRDRDNNGDEFEGYISLDLLNFDVGHTGTCFRRFPQDQDYTFYDTIEFYTQVGVPEMSDLELEFFIRFGATDGNTYYEYRRRVTSGSWQLVELPISALSDLKQNLPPEAEFIKVQQEDGSWLILNGRPSMSRVRQITLGVTNVSGGVVDAASVWVNELRLDDVERNVSTATKFNLNSRLSDLGTFTFGFTGEDADFLRVGRTRGTGIKRRQIDMATTLQFDRFVPRLNMRIPVTYSYSRDTDEPKFQTGDDVVFEGRNRELNVSRRITQNFSASYNRTPARHALLRYTVDALNANFRYSRTRSQRPADADTSSSYGGSVGYSITAPRHPFIQLPLGLAIDYLPTQFSASATFNRNENLAWQRPSSNLTEPLEFVQRTRTRSSQLGLQTSYRLLQTPSVNYTFNSSRDLLRNGRRLVGVDIGRETSRRENTSASYTLTKIPEDVASTFPLGTDVASFVNSFLVPLRPSVNWAGRFNSQANLSRLEEVGDSIDPLGADNSSDVTLRGTLPLARIVRAFRDAARRKPAAEPEGTTPPADGQADDTRVDDAKPESSGGSGSRRGPGRRRTKSPAADDERPTPVRPETPPDRGIRGEGETDDRSERPEPKRGGGSGFGIGLTFSDVSASYSTGKSSRYSFIDGMPSLAYQLGLTRDPGDIRVLATNNTSEGDTKRYDLSSGAKIRNVRFGGTRLGTTIDIKASYARNETRNTQFTVRADSSISTPTLSTSVRTEWPDIQISANGIEQGIGFLESRVRRMSISSRYQKSRSESGDQNNPIGDENINSSWSPLVSIETTMKSGMRITLSTGRRRIESVSNSSIRSISRTESSDFSFSVQHTLDRKRTVKVPGGKQRVINTRLDIGFGASLDRDRQLSLSEITNFDEVVLRDQRRLSVFADTGYNFTRSISGTGRIEYQENADFKNRAQTRRQIIVGVSATFQF